MDELMFIDVRESDGNFGRIPLATVDVPLLLNLVIGGLEAAGATAESVLGTLPRCPVFWPAPPRYMRIGRSGVHIKTSIPAGPIAELHETHARFRKEVYKYGLSPAVRHKLARALGVQAFHLLVFTDSEPSEEAANLFSLEFILTVAAHNSTLEVAPAALTRRFPGKRDNLATMRLNKTLSTELTVEWMQARLYKTRGTIMYPTVDVLDRCLAWISNQGLGAAANETRTALSWLKAIQSRDSVYELEQMLWKLEPKPIYTEKVEFGSALFNLDILNFVRDLWINTASEEHAAFRDFYDYLVPLYLDDDQFRSMFNTGMVLKKDYNPKIGRKVDAGLLRFSAWFSKMMEENNAT